MLREEGPAGVTTDRHDAVAQIFSTSSGREREMPRGNRMLEDPRKLPRYSIAEAASIVGIPVSTLRSWTVGRSYPVRGGSTRFQPPLKSPENGGLLSFEDLIEAHVLAALRSKRGLRLQAVRRAIEYAERELKVKRLLLHPNLRAAGKDLFLVRLFGELLNVTLAGQYSIRVAFEAHLQRIEWERNLPVRFFPVASPGRDEGREIIVDSRISFGRPVLASKGIPTAVIGRRFDQGEVEVTLAEDYGVTPAEIKEAVMYEGRRAA